MMLRDQKLLLTNLKISNFLSIALIYVLKQFQLTCENKQKLKINTCKKFFEIVRVAIGEFSCFLNSLLDFRKLSIAQN